MEFSLCFYGPYFKLVRLHELRYKKNKYFKVSFVPEIVPAYWLENYSLSNYYGKTNT